MKKENNCQSDNVEKGEFSSSENEQNQSSVATNQNDAEYHAYLANCYYYGLEGYKVDKQKSMTECLLAAELGHTDAMAVVSSDYSYFKSILGYDLAEAEKWARKAIELGNPEGYMGLYYVLEEQGNGKDAVAILEVGVSKGSLDCIEKLAVLLLYGKRVAGYQVKEDEDRAFQLLTSVTWDKDHSKALECIGLIYRKRGDILAAKSYWEQALSSDKEIYRERAKYELDYLLSIEEKSKIDYEKLPEYQKCYKEGNLLGQIHGVSAKGVGKKLKYSALLLYYTLMDYDVPQKDKALVVGTLGYFIRDFDNWYIWTYPSFLEAMIFAIKTIWNNITLISKTKAYNHLVSQFPNTAPEEIKLFEEDNWLS